jgi:hypothetical protein
VVDGLLCVRNRIYSRVFDQEWVIANLPGAELQRQHAAYRRGLLRAATVAAMIVLTFGALTFIAFQQRNRAAEEARRADSNLREANANAMKAQVALAEEAKQRKRAEEQEKLATQRQVEAERQRRQAIEQQQIALQQRYEIERERERADQNERLLIEFGVQRTPSTTDESKSPKANYSEPGAPLGARPRTGTPIKASASKLALKPRIGTYKRVSANITSGFFPSQLRQNATSGVSYSSELTIGLTIYRLRLTNNGNQEIERLSLTTPFTDGDKVRLSVEAARAGYLYVFDRARYADGTFGAPYLIFPIKTTHMGENKVFNDEAIEENRLTPGRIIEIPTLNRPIPFLILSQDRPDQTAHEISMLIVTKPLPELKNVAELPLLISEEQFELWKKWEGPKEELELESSGGKFNTRTEKAGEANETKRLYPDDPLPQTVYRFIPSDRGAVMFTTSLRFRNSKN